jgi:hypothetical protein
MADTEFQEIAHSGGRVTFHVVTDPQGRKAYSIKWENSRGVAAAITGIYALSIGVPVGTFKFWRHGPAIQSAAASRMLSGLPRLG